MAFEEERLDPEKLLEKLKYEEDKKNKGQLKIFFGYAAGVGKTYAMLDAARELKKQGKEVVIGYVELHNRPETLALIEGIEQIPPKLVRYKTMTQKEFDLDAAIKRHPEIVLVDELAHTNAKGERHAKRWQDVEELLAEGIDVYTTVNVQHIESLNDVVASIAGVIVRETVPDKILDEADQVELIDIAPEELLGRFAQGKIYEISQAKLAKHRFFKIDNLHALREIALRRIADRVNKEVQIARLNKKDMPILPTAEQLLVCISPSKSSARVIRTASRMAKAFNARWIAVYIETPTYQTLPLEAKKQLNQNMDLVQKLGGETTIIHGEDITEELIKYAKLCNSTKIVVGKNQVAKRFRMGNHDIVDKLLASTKYIDIHVITGQSQDYSLHKKSTSEKVSEGIRKIKIRGQHLERIKALLILAMATALAFGLRVLGFADENMMMIYTLAVLFISIRTKGYATGVASALIATLLYNYMFITPYYTFRVDDYSYLVTIIIVALTTTMLTTRIKQQTQLYSKREEHTQMLYRISRSFLNLSGEENIIAEGLERLSTGLERNIVYYKVVAGESTGKPYVSYIQKETKLEDMIGMEKEVVVDWVIRNGLEAGSGTDTLPSSKMYYIPVKGQSELLGIVGISCFIDLVDHEQHAFVQTIIAQMALVLDRERLTKNQEQIKLEIERERLRSNLLRAISHDLRTPLTGIAGASSLMINDLEQTMDEVVKQELLKGIYEDAEWLIRLVENLLSMTRIEEGKLKMCKTLEVVEEVVAEAMGHVKKRVHHHTLKVKTPKELVLANMDAKLIEQVLINLVDNALKYTPENSEIEVEVKEKGEKIIFKVSDNGNGIPEEMIPYIFDRFVTANQTGADSRRGVGLGLAICQSIIEAHDSVIKVTNKKTGGAEFTFTLKKAYGN